MFFHPWLKLFSIYPVKYRITCAILWYVEELKNSIHYLHHQSSPFERENSKSLVNVANEDATTTKYLSLLKHGSNKNVIIHQ